MGISAALSAAWCQSNQILHICMLIIHLAIVSGYSLRKHINLNLECRVDGHQWVRPINEGLRTEDALSRRTGDVCQSPAAPSAGPQQQLFKSVTITTSETWPHPVTGLYSFGESTLASAKWWLVYRYSLFIQLWGHYMVTFRHHLVHTHIIYVNLKKSNVESEATLLTHDHKRKSPKM